MAKLEENPEDKLQTAGAADLRQATASGWINDKVLQTRELGDIMLETPDPIYHETAKFCDDNLTPCIFTCSAAVLKRSQEGGMEDRGVTKYLYLEMWNIKQRDSRWLYRARFKPDQTFSYFSPRYSAVES